MREEIEALVEIIDIANLPKGSLIQVRGEMSDESHEALMEGLLALATHTEFLVYFGEMDVSVLSREEAVFALEAIANSSVAAADNSESV